MGAGVTPRRRLVMFDVDGTLTQSTLADGACYAQAMSEYLDIAVDTDWRTYRHSTESGIARELFARAGRPVPTARDLEPVRRRLVELLKTALEAEPAACAQTPGAGALIERMRSTPGVVVSIATGAWEDSARLKLSHAALPVADLPFASGNDALSREEILVVCLNRAKARAGVTDFDSVTYVGDQPWDLVAAQTLSFRFVGVCGPHGDGRLQHAGAETVIEDFTDTNTALLL